MGISKAIGQPVKVMMTREDDLRNDYYRSASLHKLKGGIDSEGKISGWMHSCSFADSVSLHPFNHYNPSPQYNDVDLRLGIPGGAWRSVGYTQEIFAYESFIDELAFLAGEDPYQFRLNHMNNGKLKNVLTDAAEKAGWGSQLPEGHGRGIACYAGYGAYIAHVVEVSVSDTGKIKVERVVASVDPKLAINPRNIEGQVKGGLIDGLATAMKSEITIDKGGVVQSNFHDFEWLWMDEAPPTEVYIATSDSSPSGMGEVVFPSVSPALCNAIFNATGVRVRKLPIKNVDLTPVEDRGALDENIKLNISPNPGKDTLNINGELGNLSPGKVDLNILNIIGQTLFSDKFNTNGSSSFNRSVNISQMNSGIYFCCISADGYSRTIKFVKK